MKCPHCGNTVLISIGTKNPDNYSRHMCELCHTIWTDWQQSRIDELEAALRPKWQTGNPPQDGWYWVTGIDTYDHESVEVVYLEPYYYDQVMYKAWSGPLLPPED
jgi:hypothetical protein